MYKTLNAQVIDAFPSIKSGSTKNELSLGIQSVITTEVAVIKNVLNNNSRRFMRLSNKSATKIPGIYEFRDKNEFNVMQMISIE